ncbi:hypothetical protein ABZP36_023556 [Zizania latifolia]
MERIIAMSVVGAGPGNVFGPAMSAGALESFVGRQGGTKAEAFGEGGAGRGGRPAEKMHAAEEAAGRRNTAAKAGNAGAWFDPALDGLYCFETISPH